LELLYKAIKLKHDGFEKRGFILNRPNGTQNYTFIHFKTPVNIKLKGEIIRTKSGACIIYAPGSLHWVESDECDLVHDWLHFIPNNEQAFKQLYLPLNHIFYPSGVYFITKRIMNCEIEFINKEMYWNETISSELSLLFMQLSRELAQNKVESLNEHMMQLKKRFKQLRIKIYNSAQENWNIDKMSCHLLLSRSRFSVIYHIFFGVSPKTDLIKARIERAKYLLLSVDENIEQIGLLSGYTNAPHFIRQFKIITGITPGEYRAQSSRISIG
jgi:AraC-like DNA-binding protein